MTATEDPQSLRERADRPQRSAAARLGAVAADAALLGLCVWAYRELAGWDPGRALSEEAPALFVPSNTSPLFIGGLSVLFLYMRIDRLRGAAARGAPSQSGWALVLPAAALHAWAAYTGATDLMLLSLIPAILGFAALRFGANFARALLLPVLFLLFAYPIPAALANQQVQLFQDGTAAMSTWLLNTSGVHAVLEGDMIYTRGRVFEVIETCSGLRITETLFASAFAYGELMCRRQLHKIAIVVMAPFLGFLLNSIRVLLIIFFPGSEPAGDHTLQGLAVIVAGVFSFALIELALERLAPSRDGDRALRRVFRADGDGGHAARVGAIGLAAAMVAVSIWIPRWSEPPAARWQITMPTDFEGWRARPLDVDETFLGSVWFSRKLYRRYEKDDFEVDVFVGRDDLSSRDRSILSPKTSVPGAGWEVVSRSRSRLLDSQPFFEEIVATRRRERRLIYHWYEGTSGLSDEILRSLAALDRSAFRRPHELRVYRISTPLDGTDNSHLEEARSRLDPFARAVRDGIETL